MFAPQYFVRLEQTHQNMLPPVADVEFYGEFFRFPPEKDYVERELTAMLQVLESHY